MKKSHLIGALCVLVFTLFTTSANAALIQSANGLGVYDNVLGITWTTDANINGTGVFSTQDAWAASLILGGETDWRLPTLDELSDQFNVNGISSATPGPFTDVQADKYWTTSSSHATLCCNWTIDFAAGAQGGFSQESWQFNAWAVADGNVFNATVPIPAAVWLFGSGLGLLGLVGRKKLALA